MAGRKHLPPVREVILTRGGATLTSTNHTIDEPRLPHRLHHFPPSSSAAVRDLPVDILERRLADQHREIQTLLEDNQRLAATHVALKQDLTVAQKEVRQLTAVAADIKAEREAEVRVIYEKSLKMDAEVRAVKAMSSELVQVQEDINELGAARKELALQLQAIESELARFRAESQQIPVIKAEIDTIRHEIQRGRNAIELEKQTYASNLEHSRTMDKNMIIMVREVEKLRAELANEDSRARAATAAAAKPGSGYLASHDNPEMRYGGITYPDSYSMHQVYAGVGAYSQYPSGAMVHHPYDFQNTNVQR
ncbi:hypothetical protein L6164_028777 [Bauhinia variegata]|uniref:Uncharacterized protein n=1 Tax=Bauhinia variegata TaxID=167791 RepID=A0ACB9L778_BAUVA|nr:hypothetical protein L6164_028777 [Bauhinia variegata]